MNDAQRKQLLLLARELYDKREFDKAERHLIELVDAGVRFADVHNMLGVIEHDRGDFSAAKKSFESAVAINSHYTEALLNLAVTCNALGLFGEAKEHQALLRERGVGAVGRAATEVEPFARGKLANLHAEVAQAYAELGLYAEAADEFRRALNLCPQFADLRTRLGNVLRDAGDFDGARGAYERAIEENARYVPARVQLGVALFTLGLREEAERAWMGALEVDPGDRSAQMYLRMVRANRMRPSVAAMAAVKALETK